jgi:hypothetical protein
MRARAIYLFHNNSVKRAMEELVCAYQLAQVLTGSCFH